MVTFVSAFVFMVSSLAIPAWLRYVSDVEQMRQAHHEAVATIAAQKAAGNLPRIVFMIEAETPQAAREKLAQVAGQVDVQRGLIK
jgi:hypothetical protein